MARLDNSYSDVAQGLEHVVKNCSRQTSGLIPLILCAGVLCGLLFYAIYQQCFHPLAKYPGPVLARFSQAYDLYHSYKGDKHILYHELHQKYGPFVRYAPNALSVNDPAALKAIYSHGANVRKSVFYECFRAGPAAISTLLATDKDHHARKRRVLGHAFSDSALRGLEQYVLGHVQELVDCLSATIPSSQEPRDGQPSAAGWSRSQNMAEWCNWLVFDIMGDLVFGRSFGTLGAQPENRRGIWLLGRAARRNYTVAAMPGLVLSGLERVLPVLRSLYQDRCQYLAFGKHQVVLRTQREEAAKSQEKQHPASKSQERRDIFTFLLGARDPETGQGMPLGELWMEGNTLIVAGSDTTSTTLAAALYYLLHNPSTLRRLEQEIRTTFAHAEDIRMGPSMHSCAYLRSCIDETLRMSPAVGGLLPREVCPGGFSIPALGVHLPAGTEVGIPIYALQHHDDYVKDPFVFDPMRWLSSNDSGATTARDDLHSVFNPFSVGPRACLGKPLVYMELSIALARLLWEFDLRPTPKSESADTTSEGTYDDSLLDSEIRGQVRAGRRHPKEYHLRDWFMSQNDGPSMQLRRRQV